jgi:hypothetical protein
MNDENIKTVFTNGSVKWSLGNVTHREDGPARSWPSGYEQWYLHGKKHRDDGPSVVFPKRSGHHYHIQGKNITKQVNVWLKEHNISWPFTPVEKVLFKLTFGE